MAMSPAAMMLVAAEVPAQADCSCSTSCVSVCHRTVLQDLAPYLILPGGMQLPEQSTAISVHLSESAVG